jgi:hypothetical protein
MQKKSEKPTQTTEDFCGTNQIKHTHPAFGMVGLTHTTGAQLLFGSEMHHQNYITIRIKQGQEIWRHHEKSYTATHGKDFIEIALSASQFAEFITCPNRGEGVPCTIMYVNNEQIPRIEKLTETTRERVKAELQDKNQVLIEKLAELEKRINEGSLKKQERENINSSFIKLKNEIVSNIPFILDQYQEAIEKITSKAKTEIETYARFRLDKYPQNLSLPEADNTTKPLELKP